MDEVVEKLQLLLDKQDEHIKFYKDISAKIILRQIEISEQVRALNARLDTIDYSTKVIHEELMG